MPNVSIPVPIAVKVVVAVRLPVLIPVHVQISLTARILSPFWLLEKPADRLFRVIFSGAPMVTLAFCGRLTLPVLLSVTVRVVLVPDVIIVAAAVMVTVVLGLMTLTVT